nr:reverse transcriptase domain-containing protein [Tanacetum cinerariifolium]
MTKRLLYEEGRYSFPSKSQVKAVEEICVTCGVYDDDFEDIEYIEASLLDPEIVSIEEENGVEEENVVQREEEEVDLEDISQVQDVVFREKLFSITRLISNIESLNDNSTPDRMFNSFESDNSLLDNFSPKCETFFDHSEETRSGNTTQANYSLPEYDLFCLEIDPDQERLINLVENNNSDSSNDPLLEKVDLFLSDNSISPDNSTPDRVLNSFESDNSLLDNISPEFETFCDHSEETRSGNTTHANYSLLEYDSFCFEIEPDQERLINLMKNDVPDNSSNDPLLEEVLLFNSRLKIFSEKLKSIWSGPFIIAEIYPYGTAKLIHPDGCNFQVNCHRLKHYHGGDLPPLEIPDVTTFSKDN